jgi:hypothetical protein
MKISPRLCIAIALVFCSVSQATAGVYADDFGKCLVNATNKDDRANLIRWFFVAAAHNPEVKPLASVTPAQQEESDKAMGALMMRLLTDSCKTEAQKAIQYEGPNTIELAFAVLGKVAGSEIFSNPDVMAGLKSMTKYLDADKLKALMSGSASQQK